MRVLEDVTLLWTDDNWGNVRRLPPSNGINVNTITLVIRIPFHCLFVSHSLSAGLFIFLCATKQATDYSTDLVSNIEISGGSTPFPCTGHGCTWPAGATFAGSGSPMLAI
jgi:hypothetical protein